MPRVTVQLHRWFEADIQATLPPASYNFMLLLSPFNLIFDDAPELFLISTLPKNSVNAF